ncbi:hypothetical protein IFO68_17415 [Photobacterium sp. CAU 1568]|uniref:Uncharacterized protein n=1 Tax=Photobacterium arenosum TaxID=2774143 RepID=A0ABR9BQD0_9GAMM|nr:hypothetical protein [Photobacterium arenosum]MBD8514463.1 hypothetical protein [Photobacterium arenosum]
MSRELQSNKYAGFLFVALIVALSVMPSVSFVGDYVEKAIKFVAFVFTLTTVAALAGIWRGSIPFKARELKAIALGLPIVSLIDLIYPSIKYSDQGYFSEVLFTFSIEFCIVLSISSLIWSAAKK